MSTLKVNTLRHTGATSDAVTLASDGTCTAKITNNLSNRNLIINGDFKIAQRGTSSGSSGYKTVDRWTMSAGGANAALTQSQHDLTSSDTGPWEKGFRKSFHILNAGQTGPDAGDYLELYTYLEDQDISQSGWDYASSSSYLTISFWVKSSVAQKFYGFLYTNQAAAGDCKMYSYVIDNGSGGNLAANTWTKITHKIPGDSSLTFNNDNTNGLAVGIFPFDGTDMTTSGHSLNTWAAWSSSNKVPDMTSTWWTTNDATFEITGVQLEVGDVATEFEHRSYTDELLRCYRYCKMDNSSGSGSNYHWFGQGFSGGVNYAFFLIDLPVPMRVTPSLVEAGIDDGSSSSDGNGMKIDHRATNGLSIWSISSAEVYSSSTPERILVYVSHTSSGTQGCNAALVAYNNKTAYLLLEAEL